MWRGKTEHRAVYVLPLVKLHSKSSIICNIDLISYLMFHFVYDKAHISRELAVKIELQNKKMLYERALHQNILSGNQYAQAILWFLQKFALSCDLQTRSRNYRIPVFQAGRNPCSRGVELSRPKHGGGFVAAFAVELRPKA